MASSADPHPNAGRAKRTSFGSFSGANASHLLDKNRIGARGSTPDSEALMSSDDELDQAQRLPSVTSNPATKSVRRQQTTSLKTSIGSCGPFSPNSPSTTTPASDHTFWSSTTANAGSGRGPSGSVSFPWSSTIWNSDSQKVPPRRLTEVLPSPTSAIQSGSLGFYSDERIHSPPYKEGTAQTAFPFAIPLQPTPKSYRSQSYSVGQLDSEATRPSVSHAGHTSFGRSRLGTSYAGLQHRLSRPSVLSDAPHDAQGLGQLREVEDDEDCCVSVDSMMQMPSHPPIEHLARENAMLRKALAEREEGKRQDCEFAGTITSQATYQRSSKPPRCSREAHFKQLDNAVIDADDSEEQRMNDERRISEQGATPGKSDAKPSHLDYKMVEHVKKGQWQSSLGFNGVGEIPRSRRHSFADVPTRQNSVGSREDTDIGHGMTIFDSGSLVDYRNPFEHGDQGSDAVRYLAQHRPARDKDQHTGTSSTDLQPSHMSNFYPRHQDLSGQINHRQKHKLYIVTFKAQRADIFYVQDSTGFCVNKGDLVIVEADRGTDLGTVATDIVPWAEAKGLKEQYIRKHHEWLMMFSQHGQNGTIAAQNPNGVSVLNSGSSGQSGFHDVSGGELKPKMIKRVAQNHEIQALREKEGAEAKAKRACHQKVVEHRLRMEILDAEFQMDWKKLTFFYFADSYINFNPLVTDLFKIYKTRIWMSAINTAAIGLPAGGHHPFGVLSHRNISPKFAQLSSRRHATHDSGPLNTGHYLAPFGANDQMWSHRPKESGIHDGIFFPSILDQNYNSPQYAHRQSDHSAMLQYGHVVGTAPTSLNAPICSSPALHNSTFLVSRTENRNTASREMQSEGFSWGQTLQGLSLN